MIPGPRKIAAQEAVEAASRHYPGNRLDRVFDRPGELRSTGDPFDDAILGIILDSWVTDQSASRNCAEIMRKLELARHAMDLAWKGIMELRDRSSRMENGDDEEE